MVWRFKEDPQEVPSVTVVGNIYIYEAGKTPSTPLPCFPSRFFSCFQKETMPYLSPPSTSSQNTLYQLRCPPHTFPPTDSAHKARTRYRGVKAVASDVLFPSAGSLATPSPARAAHTFSQQRAVTHRVCKVSPSGHVVVRTV